MAEDFVFESLKTSSLERDTCSHSHISQQEKRSRNFARSSQLSLKITTSQQLSTWLKSQNIALAFTTYQSNRLIFVGNQANGRLKIHERLFDKPMGLYARGESLYMGSRYQIWHFNNLVTTQEKTSQCDRLYAPRTAHITGDINARDLVLDDSARIIFINTDFSCLATISPDYNFVPLWQPPFISQLVAEDRCHLNGLAMKEGKPAYVTACSASNTAAGWRKHMRDGGIVIDVENNEIITTGLSMPHSPRWYRGRLWLLNSGTGELGYVADGKFIPLTFCPGFVRGLTFWGDYAFVGLSKLRSSYFSGLTLAERLAAEGNTAHCGLMAIDLTNGKIVHWLHIGQNVEELYDVVILPGIQKPEALGLQEDNIQRLVTFPNSGGIITTKPSAKQNLTIKAVSDRVKYQRVYHLNPNNAIDYEYLTYPSLQKRYRKQPPRGELLGIAASVAGSLVGLAIVEILHAQTAVLISLLVLPHYRRQGIGTKLLLYLERELLQQGCQELTLTYQTNDLTQVTLEPLIKKLNWKSPQIQLILGQTSTEKIAQAPWLYRYSLSESFQVFPWTELSQQEKQNIQQHNYPGELSPFTEESNLEPLTSLGLRYGDRIIGWLITHRVASDTIRYTTFYVAKPWANTGRGIGLLAEAIYRQVNSDIPYLTGSIALYYPRLWQFAKKYLYPYTTYLSELRQTRKKIEGS